MLRLQGLLGGLFLALSLLIANAAHALTPEQALRIAAGDNDERIAALNDAVARGDAALAPFVEALLADEVKIAGGRALVVHDGTAVDAATGAVTALGDNAEDVVNNNQMRGEYDAALATIKLFAADAKTRLNAVTTLSTEPDEGKLPLVEKAYAAELVPAIKDALGAVRFAILLGSTDKAKLSKPPPRLAPPARRPPRRCCSTARRSRPKPT